MSAITTRSGTQGGLSIKANFAWLFVGTLVYGIAQWGWLILIARLGSPADVGRYALALAICSPVFLFFEGKLREVQATDVRSSVHLSDYILVRTWSVAIALAVSIVLAAAFPWLGTGVLVVAAVGWTKAVESLGDILHGRMQLNERMDLIAKSRMVKGLVGLAAGGAALALTSSLSWMMLAVGAAWVVVIGLLDVRYLTRLQGMPTAPELVRWLRAHGSLQRSRRLVKDMLPLGIVSAVVSLRETLPRIILQQTHGVAAVGFFMAAMTLPEAGKRIVDPLGQALLPRLATHLAEDRRQFFRLLRRAMIGVVALAIAGLLLALVAGEALLGLLYGREYVAYGTVLVIGVVATGVNFLASITNVAVLATRRFLVQLPAAVIAALGVVGASVVWIPSLGAVGAAMALGIGMVVWAGALGVALWLALRADPIRADA